MASCYKLFTPRFSRLKRLYNLTLRVRLLKAKLSRPRNLIAARLPWITTRGEFTPGEISLSHHTLNFVSVVHLYVDRHEITHPICKT